LLWPAGDCLSHDRPLVLLYVDEVSRERRNGGKGEGTVLARRTLARCLSPRPSNWLAKKG